MSRNLESTRGGFVAVPIAFEGTPQSIINAFKLEMVPKIIVKRELGKTTEHAFGTDVVTNRALVDFAEVDAGEIDYDKLERDCEIMKDALGANRDEIDLVLKLVCSGKATIETIEAAATSLAKVGLTEGAFREKGGGLIGLLVVIGLALLAEGCRGCAHLSGARRDEREPEIM